MQLTGCGQAVSNNATAIISRRSRSNNPTIECTMSVSEVNTSDRSGDRWIRMNNLSMATEHRRNNGLG